MKTDRELLELAARSIGLLGSWSEYHRGITYSKPGSLDMHVWSPLTNDGDALRLAVDLDINIAEAQAGIDWDEANRLALTRRTIVRAAAAIGESMQ